MSTKRGRPRQSHCRHGHSLDDAYQRYTGQRYCRHSITGVRSATL